MPRGYLDRIVPASDGAEAALRLGLAADAARRLRRALRAWGDRAVRARLVRVGPGSLASGALRGWLAQVEDALAIRRAAARATRRGAAWSRLMDLVTDQGRLADLAPDGRLPDDFPARASALARELLARQAAELPLLLPMGTFIVSFREEIDLGRPGNELEFPGGGVRLRRAPKGPRSVKVVVRDGTVRVGGIAAPLGHDRPIPSVGATLRSGARRISVGARDPAFESRVGRAIDLLRAVWPDGERLVSDRTWRVVPLHEPGTVSFSSLKRPGVVYVNVRSAPLVRLAEDLLHESAHLRLHEIETLHPLIAAAAAGEDGPRFYSPWRREWRPLRGLLHACCTFTVGAGYFDRLLDASTPRGPGHLADARRAWVARRFLEEMEMVRTSLPILRRGAREKALTREGARFAAAIEREYAALRGKTAPRRRALEASAAGRRHLAAFERMVATLRDKPVRWAW